MWNRDARRAALVRTVLRLLAWLPLRCAQGIGGAAGRAAVIFPNGPRRVAETNLALCFPELSARDRRRRLAQTLAETGKTAAEMGALWLWPAPQVLALVREVPGGEVLSQALSQGKGLILACPHLGAWELAGLYCATRCKLTALYRPPRMAALDAMIRSARERSGARLVPTDPSGIRALFQALRRGDAVGILPDQDPGRERGVFAPFFGIPTNTMTLVSRLAASTGAPVVLVHAERLPRGAGYRMRFVPAPEDIANADPVTAAAALNRAVESCVRARPEQYQWTYKRFKTRPAGERRYY
jgi:KDO2-lipid IV(A) lauroyltransferase